MEVTQLIIVGLLIFIVISNIITFGLTIKKYVKPLRFEKSELVFEKSEFMLLLQQKRVNNNIDINVGSTFHIPHHQSFLESVRGKQFAIISGPNSKGTIVIKLVGDSSNDTYKTSVDQLHVLIWPTGLNNFTHKFLKNG